MKRKNIGFKNKIVTTCTPLRISFIGGGTDMPYFYNKYTGITISSSIDKFIYVTIKLHKNFNEKYRLNYYETETVNKIDVIKNLRIRETLKFFKIKEPLYISTISDLPYNSGLGSSSSFLIGLIHAIFLLKDLKINYSKICEIAFEIENRITNNSLGKQDHYIAAHGGLKRILYKKTNIKVNKINISKKKLKLINDNLIFFWTGKSRLSNKNLSNQKKNFKLNVQNLLELKKLTSEFYFELLKKNINFKNMGSLLHKSWILKKSFTKYISNNYLDSIYAKAISAGCYGGKLLGAGGGGFFLFFCKKKFHKKVENKLKGCKKINFYFENKGTVLKFKN